VKRLKAEMKKQRYNAASLARAMDRSPASIYYIFDVEMSTLPTLTLIAKVLGCDPKGLIT